MADPRISVIMPIYNAAGTIAQTIASVLAQSRRDFEIVAIDDGSIDDTGAILQTLAQGDRRLRVWRFANAGQAIARNRGLARARGEFVAFLDADDWWTVDKLAAQLAALEAHPAAALAYSWTDYVDDRAEFSHRGSYVDLSGPVLGPLLQLNFLENGSNPLVRRSALEALGWPAVADPAPIGPFDPALVPSEDWDLWLRLAARFEFVCVPRVQVLYRVAAGSQSTNVARLERSGTACLRRAIERVPALEARRVIAFGNFYKYLLYKYLAPRLDRLALAAARPSPRQWALGWHLWSQLLRYDPAIARSPVHLKILLGLAAIGLFPSGARRSLLDRLGRRARWLDPQSLLGYIRRPTEAAAHRPDRADRPKNRR